MSGYNNSDCEHKSNYEFCLKRLVIVNVIFIFTYWIYNLLDCLFQAHHFNFLQRAANFLFVIRTNVYLIFHSKLHRYGMFVLECLDNSRFLLSS